MVPGIPAPAAVPRCHSEYFVDDEEDNFWWTRGIFQNPRAVVKWDHVDESRPSRGIVEPGRKVSYSELFFDLVMVTNISLLGEAYQHDKMHVLEIAVCYRVLYECWSTATLYATKYYTDDIISKMVMGALMFCFILCGVKLDAEFPDNASNLGFYAGVFHLVMLFPNFRVWSCLREYRTFVWRDALLPCIVKGFGLIASSYAPAEAVLPLFIIWPTASIIWTLIHYGCLRVPKAKRAPMDLDHFIDRRHCFRLIVLGEVVTGLTINPETYTWFNIGMIAAGFLVVFNMKLLAFDVDIVPLKRHCLHVGDVRRVVLFVESAFLFDGAMGLAGSCIKIVLGTLLKHGIAHGDHYYPDYERAKNAHLLLCACIAFGIAMLTIERLTHDHGHIFDDDDLKEKAADANAFAPPYEETKEETSRLLPNYGSTRQKKASWAADVEDPAPAVMTAKAREKEHWSKVFAKHIFRFQLCTRLLATVLATILGFVCLRIDQQYEFFLVLLGLFTVALTLNPKPQPEPKPKPQPQPKP